MVSILWLLASQVTIMLFRNANASCDFVNRNVFISLGPRKRGDRATILVDVAQAWLTIAFENYRLVQDIYTKVSFWLRFELTIA